MIEIKTIGVWGFEGAIIGMRMPFESFNKSDSRWWDCKEVDCENCTPSIGVKDCSSQRKFYIGEADMALCKKLIKGGSEHRKFMRMIHVQAEVKAPRYFTQELATYKVGTAMNSSSTMHLLTKRHLTADDFSNCFDRVVMQDLIAEINELIDIYNDKTLCEYDRDEYFMEICRTVAKRATCDRGRSGCVITKNNRILVTGYVGSPAGLPHCDEVGHQLKKMVHEDGTVTQHCVRTVHAEQNAICQAAKNGISIDGATLYCKMTPCRTCAMLIINCGIKRVVCEKRYHDSADSLAMFQQAGVEIVHLNDEVQQYDKM